MCHPSEQTVFWIFLGDGLKFWTLPFFHFYVIFEVSLCLSKASVLCPHLISPGVTGGVDPRVASHFQQATTSTEMVYFSFFSSQLLSLQQFFAAAALSFQFYVRD